MFIADSDINKIVQDQTANILYNMLLATVTQLYTTCFLCYKAGSQDLLQHFLWFKQTLLVCQPEEQRADTQSDTRLNTQQCQPPR